MRTSSVRTLPFLFVELALAAAAAGQSASHAPSLAQLPGGALGKVGAESTGLCAAPGGFRGGGPDYRVEFDASGMRFTPALGRTAERAFPLAFELESVTAGGLPLACEPAAPERSGDAVVYRRGELTERYDLSAAGVEQSFVFETLPAGRGELIVRGRLSSELALVRADERTGLVLERAGLGGVRYGGVTGVDALGRTAPGWLRLEGGLLELGLPAEFVATAALPLVLDPLVTPLILVNTADPDDNEVDVAFDETAGYLVVWTRTFAAGDTEIRGQLLESDGTLAGGLLILSDSDKNTDPSVGSLPSGDAFLVAWEHRASAKPDADVDACVVHADGTVTLEIPVGATAADELDPEVGQGWVQCPLVWRDAATGLKAAAVELDFFGDPTFSYVYAVTTNPADRSPAISDADSAYALLVWVRDTPLLGSDAIWGRRLLGSTPVYDEFLIHSSSNVLSSPACAMSEYDNDYFVVWTSGLPIALAPHDVDGVRVTFPMNDPHVGSVIDIETDAAQDERYPAIAYAENQYIVAFLESDAAGDYVTALGLDSMTGQRLEKMSVAGPDDLGAPSIAGVADPDAAGDNSDDVLIAWPEIGAGDGDVHAALAEGFSGTLMQHSDACSYNGLPRASALHSENKGHRQELWNAEPGYDAILGIGWTPFEYDLGTATLRIDLKQSIAVYAGPVDANGYVGLKVPIPKGLAGVTLWSQWALLHSGTPCTSLGVDLTNSLEMLIE